MLAGFEAWKTLSRRMCQHCTPSVLTPLPIALPIEHFDIPSHCSSWVTLTLLLKKLWFVRYRNGQEDSPCPITSPSNCSISQRSDYLNSYCPHWIQRHGRPTFSSYCSSSYSSSESSGPLLSRHPWPRYLKLHLLSPRHCLLPSFLLPRPSRRQGDTKLSIFSSPRGQLSLVCHYIYIPHT